MTAACPAMTPQGAALLAQYNRWMNERLFDAAARLDAAALAADRGAFFGSILGTLNHIAVADIIWLRRFARHRGASSVLEALGGFPAPSSLRETLALDLAGLRRCRTHLDELIVRWVSGLTSEQLSSELCYANMAGAVSTRSFAAVLQHFFNHQTHHRGQASTLLFQAGVDVGTTDLLALIPRSDA